MKFSVCIPNYNYQSYLGKTLDSVLSNHNTDFEILISDNASTDKSVSIVKEYQKQYSNISLKVNPTNLGFAANLDCAGLMSTGEYMIMLSSDDVMASDALSTYHDALINNTASVLCSSWRIIDSKDNDIGFTGPNPNLWFKEDKDEQLSGQLNCDVYRVPSKELLKRCLQNMSTPFNFCTAAYRRNWYEAVGGYGGGRLMNPDKWFHWKLLMVATDAIFINKPLFAYRWHAQNQVSQETSFGHLRFLMDEYRNTIELTDAMLEKAGLSRNDSEKNFINRSIVRHGIGEFVKGRWLKSLRIYLFGFSVFPARFIVQPLFLVYSLLLLSTPLGSKISKLVFRMFQK